MSFLEEILASPIELIQDYIKEHQKFSNKLNVWYRWYNINLKTIKINSAKELLKHIRQYLHTPCITSSSSTLKPGLEFILNIIQEQITLIKQEREKKGFKEGIYDIRLNIFKTFLIYILENRLKNIDYIISYSNNDPNKNIIKILSILEKSLLTTVFNQLVSPNDNTQLLIKFLIKYISTLESIQIVDTTNKEMILNQICLLKNILDGIIFDLEKKPELSKSLPNITSLLINDLNNIKKSIIQKQNLYSPTCSEYIIIEKDIDQPTIQNEINLEKIATNAKITASNTSKTEISKRFEFKQLANTFFLPKANNWFNNKYLPSAILINAMYTYYKLHLK